MIERNKRNFQQTENNSNGIEFENWTSSPPPPPRIEDSHRGKWARHRSIRYFIHRDTFENDLIPSSVRKERFALGPISTWDYTCTRRGKDSVKIERGFRPCIIQIFTRRCTRAIEVPARLRLPTAIGSERDPWIGHARQHFAPPKIYLLSNILARAGNPPEKQVDSRTNSQSYYLPARFFPRARERNSSRHSLRFTAGYPHSGYLNLPHVALYDLPRGFPSISPSNNSLPCFCPFSNHVYYIVKRTQRILKFFQGW